jgi:hypothetical protein
METKTFAAILESNVGYKLNQFKYTIDIDSVKIYSIFDDGSINPTFHATQIIAICEALAISNYIYCENGNCVLMVIGLD